MKVERALIRDAARSTNPTGPTKTGETWRVPMCPPFEALLALQQTRTRLGRDESWVFPGPSGRTPMGYSEWRKRGWLAPLRRARVSPREGDAQKACRRSFVTSALICGRNPKFISAEVGHTTTRMIMDVYDSFVDPGRWPGGEERAALAEIYGWDLNESTTTVQPVGPSGCANRDPAELSARRGFGTWSTRPGSNWRPPRWQCARNARKRSAFTRTNHMEPH